MSDLNIEQKPSRRLWIFAAVGALALHVGGVALAVAHLQDDDPDDSLGRTRDRGRAGNGIAARSKPPICRPVRTPMPRSLRRRWPSRRPRSRRPNCPRKCRPKPKSPIGWWRRTNSKKPKEDDPKVADGADLGLNGIGRAEATATPSTEAIPEGPRSVAPAQGTGKACSACVRPGRRNCRPSRQAQALSGGTLAKDAPRSSSASCSTGWVMCCRPTSSRDPAIRVRRSRACDGAKSDPVPMPPPLVADEGLNFTLPVIFRVKGHS